MRLIILSIVLSLFAALPVSAAAEGDRAAQVDRAIARGLDSLQVMQDKREGCWRDRNNRPNPAVTGLAVMAFLSAGHLPGEGRYGAVVEKGIRWVLRKQQANGLLATDGHQEMYQHGIATLMLAEAAGMTRAALGQDIRKAVGKAVRIILKAQRTSGQDRGGWRYRVAHVEGTDISVTGWQVMALRAARNLGCDVPVEAIDRAVAYIKRCQDNGGGFRYMPGRGVTVACTGTSILALEICGKEHHHSDEAKRGGAFLLLKQNLPREGQDWFFYSIYYGSQAAFQLGGNYEKIFRPRLHEVLLHMQKGGFWDGKSRDAQQGGRAYCTAMAILALTVEYRFLPIYQRGEEPTEK
ncbi:MAG: prenyltransferase/squalene oxidase repeat-containing protein [Gemmataceae bacterium]